MRTFPVLRAWRRTFPRMPVPRTFWYVRDSETKALLYVTPDYPTVLAAPPGSFVIETLVSGSRIKPIKVTRLGGPMIARTVPVLPVNVTSRRVTKP